MFRLTWTRAGYVRIVHDDGSDVLYTFSGSLDRAFTPQPGTNESKKTLFIAPLAPKAFFDSLKPLAEELSAFVGDNIKADEMTLSDGGAVCVFPQSHHDDASSYALDGLPPGCEIAGRRTKRLCFTVRASHLDARGRVCLQLVRLAPDSALVRTPAAPSASAQLAAARLRLVRITEEYRAVQEEVYHLECLLHSSGTSTLSSR